MSTKYKKSIHKIIKNKCQNDNNRLIIYSGDNLQVLKDKNTTRMQISDINDLDYISTLLSDKFSSIDGRDILKNINNSDNMNALSDFIRDKLDNKGVFVGSYTDIKGKSGGSRSISFGNESGLDMKVINVKRYNEKIIVIHHIS
jgi:hypothetical protein